MLAVVILMSGQLRAEGPKDPFKDARTKVAEGKESLKKHMRNSLKEYEEQDSELKEAVEERVAKIEGQEEYQRLMQLNQNKDRKVRETLGIKKEMMRAYSDLVDTANVFIKQHCTCCENNTNEEYCDKVSKFTLTRILNDTIIDNVDQKIVDPVINPMMIYLTMAYMMMQSKSF